MAVVRNLMIRIGADYSAARQAMQGATRDLNRFKSDTTQTMKTVSGRRGIGGIGYEFRNLGNTITSSLSQIRGAKGIGGITSALGSLRPMMGSATKGLSSMGAAAGGAGAAFGGAALGIGAFVAVLGLATLGIYNASQAAVKFEADLGRLNMQLGGNSRAFMDWARSVGLAKTTATEMGATYSTLLSSFIRDSDELASQTKQIVQTTRVVASATGRSIQDVTERMRSGLLGNTEAIEDLGIFVNVAMIESTNAFKKFANGKHWDELDFQVQQQIRLAAILEQAYARYGDKLQNNVMTKQTLLMEQLKDIKLNLSQAFLPIWDTILPALTRLAESLAYVTEEIARFMYWLHGWDYDERTQGTNEQTDAIIDQGKAYEDLGKQAKTARKELAAFDQLNLLGHPTGGGIGSGGGSAGGTGTGGTEGGIGGSRDPWGGIPPATPLLNKKWRIEFDKPNPPDAGIGAVATAVSSTVNRMIAETKAKLAQMWADLQLQTQAGVAGQLQGWNGLSFGLAGGIVPAMATSINAQWAKMWADMQAQTSGATPTIQGQVATTMAAIGQNVASTVVGVRTNWKALLSEMLADLVGYRPGITTEWEQIKTSISSIKNPLSMARTEWHGALDFMQSKLNAYKPYLEYGWSLIKNSLMSIRSEIELTKNSWANALSSMAQVAATQTASIVSSISNAIRAIRDLNQATPGSQPSTMPYTRPSTIEPIPNAKTTAPDPLSIEGFKNYFQIVFGEENLKRAWGVFETEAAKPENQAALSALGLFTGGGRLLKSAADLLKNFPGLFRGIPAFATGGVVFGPTLAMVGDNRGAMSDPELIGPASMFQDYLDTGSAETVVVLRQILGAIERGQNVQVTVSRNDVGRAAVDYINGEQRRGRNPLRGL